jgi:tRNA (cmo5U34)-methyltransferase
MGVATHLGIHLDEYDSRIRTFIPDYEEMLEVGANAIPAGTGRILDLGIGTGAFAYKCRERVRTAEVVGVDADTEILKAATQRLGGSVRLISAGFEEAALPDCDVVISSFALHHIRTQDEKRAMYSRIYECLRDSGRFVLVDCCPAEDAELAREQMAMWKQHLRQSYADAEATAYLSDWAQEDTYQPLTTEFTLLRDVGFAPEVLWRKGAFAVVLASKR